MREILEKCLVKLKSIILCGIIKFFLMTSERRALFYASQNPASKKNIPYNHVIVHYNYFASFCTRIYDYPNMFNAKNQTTFQKMVIQKLYFRNRLDKFEIYHSR